MSFVALLTQELSPKHLLKHPFYQSWTDGTLSRETLKTYAGQYFHHVSAFPRFLSATHSACGDLKTRQMLLENLIDEEQGAENHPELWTRFAEAMGEDRANLGNLELLPETKALVDTFLTAARSSFEEGLGALYAYEHQIPEIAQFKMDALVTKYGVTNPESVKFFDVHRLADVYHTQAITDVINGLTPAQQEKVRASAKLASDRLWAFLDGMQAQSHCAA